MPAVDAAAIVFRAIIEPGVSVSATDQKDVERWVRERWEVAAPLRPYSELAAHHGDEAERERTAALLLDLRQPVYDSRAVFLFETERTRQLLDAWGEEKQHCRCTGFCGLPFLRALWRVRPLILALPAEWIQEQAA